MRLIILAIALLSLTTAFATNNNNETKPKRFSITGTVQDNTESLTGVKIILDGKEVTVYTDFEGNFTIENVLAGEHSISLSLITYNNKEVTFNSETSNKLEINLEAK